jgi:hypothetical protein
VVYYFLLLITFVTAPPPVQTAPDIPGFVRTAVARALNYNQGDRPSLVDAQDDFTTDAWREFMRRMDGWLDENGAPLGNSSFTATGDAIIKGYDLGVMHLTIPGTLKQSQNQSSTTYQVLVDVQVSGIPPKITHLEPTVRLK